jgi:hypothetical protein
VSLFTQTCLAFAERFLKSDRSRTAPRVLRDEKNGRGSSIFARAARAASASSIALFLTCAILCGGCAGEAQNQPAATPAEVANDPIHKAPSGSTSEPPWIQGKTFTAVTPNGRRLADLELCATTLDQAVADFPKAPTTYYQGNPRAPQGYPPVSLGAVHPRPATVFSPWGTQYQLYFDANHKLVIVQAMLSGSNSLDQLTGKYPTLKETFRDANSVEMQAEVEKCVAVMTLSRPGDPHVDQLAYACTCATQ